MSSDAPFTPPKKKPSIFWWIGGAFLLLLLLFVFQLFGPSPRIIVSPQTTYITAPLGPDGLPDYEKYVLDLYRDGVTPENNAASLIWPALWPGELDPSQFAAIATELGLDHIPTGSEILVPIYKRIQVLQREAYGAVHDDTPGSHSSDDMASDQAELERNTDQLFNFVTEQPWTSDQLPVLAKWARDNQEPLDKLVEASRRPRCYFPSPSLIDQKPESLVMMLLPGAQGVREAGRSLRARAMWHVGEQRLDDAWQDLYAANRIGHLTAHGLTLVEQLVGMAISSSACDGTITMLHHGAPTAEQSRKILRDLYKLEYFSGIGDSIDHMERASFLNSTILLAQGKMDEQEFRSVGIENIVFAKYIAIDWNAVLRKGNSYYDRYAAAARLPTHAARRQAVSQLDNELASLARGFGANSIVAAVLSRSARSDAATTIMFEIFLPALNAALTAQDRENTRLDLTRLAAALAVYRAEHCNYPEKLADLAPTILDQLPVDLFNAKPFIYKRIVDGYLLYSAGENGADDGGSNDQRNIFEGQPFDDLQNLNSSQPPQIPSGADDISIRVPRSPIRLPK